MPSLRFSAVNQINNFPGVYIRVDRARLARSQSKQGKKQGRLRPRPEIASKVKACT